MTKTEFRFFIARMIGYPVAITSLFILIIGDVKIERDLPMLVCGSSLGFSIAVSQEFLRILK